MKLSTTAKISIFSIIFFFLAFTVALPVFAQTTASQTDAASSLKILLKIKDLNNTLDQLDAYAGEGAGPSATSMLKGMLQGTDWIDPSRCIVLGFDFSGEIPTGAALIPFMTENEGFQSAFNAAAAEDYYLIALPPGKGGGISVDAEQTLVRASVILPDTALCVELAMADLLADSRSKVDALLDTMERQMSGHPHDPMAPGPKAMDEMVSGMLDTLSQLERLTLGIDLGRNDIVLAMSTAAKDQSAISTLFSSAGKTSRLKAYRPGGDITYRSKGFDVAAMMEIFDAGFGKMYQEMGFDFSRLAHITQYFTGESAGGVTYEKAGMKMEMIHVLKGDVSTDNFLDEVYIPWIMEYGKSLSEIYKNAGMADMGQPFIRLPDIVIDGLKVAGLKYRFPFMMTPGHDPGGSGKPIMMESTFRIATKGDLLLTAPDQNRMAVLISMADTLKKAPDDGPMMSMVMDMAAYFNYLAEMIPEASPVPAAGVPKPGKIFIQTDFKRGTAFTTARMNTDFIKGMIAMAAKARSTGTGTVSPPASSEPGTTVPVKKVSFSEPAVKSAEYWIDKGNLVATYGNEKAAVRFYKEALKLDPQNSAAHFNLGISYGELGQYDDAIDAINQAIRLDPRKGNYYYGRGRVHLLAGDREQAMRDFRTAAEMGNRDAQEYLNTRK